MWERHLNINLGDAFRCTDATLPEMIERGWGRVITSADDALAALKKMSPLNRLITAEEVAALAVLLASAEGRGINGQAINVEGGTVLF